MSWQHVHEYPIDYHENSEYRVQWHWEGGTRNKIGGTRNKIWVATNPEGKTSTHRSKYDAMHACEAGIAKRVRSK